MLIQKQLSTFYGSSCLLIAIFTLASLETTGVRPTYDVIAAYLFHVWKNRKSFAVSDDGFVTDSAKLAAPVSKFVPHVAKVQELYRKSGLPTRPGYYVTLRNARNDLGKEVPHFECSFYDGRDFYAVDLSNRKINGVIEYRQYSFA